MLYLLNYQQDNYVELVVRLAEKSILFRNCQVFFKKCFSCCFNGFPKTGSQNRVCITYTVFNHGIIDTYYFTAVEQLFLHVKWQMMFDAADIADRTFVVQFYMCLLRSKSSQINGYKCTVQERIYSEFHFLLSIRLWVIPAKSNNCFYFMYKSCEWMEDRYIISGMTIFRPVNIKRQIIQQLFWTTALLYY